MKRLSILKSTALAVAALLACSAAPSFAVDDAPAAPDVDQASGPQVYTGNVTAEQLGQIRAVGLDFEDIAAAPSDSGGLIRVEVVMNSVLAQRLLDQGIDLVAKSAARAQLRTLAAPAYEVFRSWSEPGGLRDEMVTTAEDNDGLTQLVTIGQSVQGQDILAMRITKNADNVRRGARKSVLYASAQHAREWITPEMTRRLMNYYLDNYGTDPEVTKIVDTTELWFVLVANPDGYDFTFTEGNRLWRKNLADNNGDGIIEAGDGVDPNRNWPTRWGYDNEGSSPDPFSETYRGPSPASEPETQAMDRLMQRIDFEYMVNYHSAAELLLYGTGWQVATPTPDDLIYEALVGDDANPAVPGYDPDIAAELYTTNGETTEHAHNARGTLAFTPEMATCETASAVDPEDAFDPADCESVFNFPDSEVLVQAEFEKNIPFALSVAKSAKDPDNPVSALGLEVPDFAVDAFSVSYGSPQTVAVTARQDLRRLRARYSINGGPTQITEMKRWRGGERYGDEGDLYYAEYRTKIKARAGDSVEVWFTGTRPGRNQSVRESEHFTYVVAEDTGNDVLVIANEDYTGVNPIYDPAITAPKYADAYVASLAANGIEASVWDVTSQGVPHDLGVLDHFDAVVWYQGDNRLTQDPEDELTDTFLFGPLPDLSVAEREQYLTLAVRDYLNAGGKALVTGETAGYTGLLGGAVGGIYYGLDGAPEEDCVVTQDFFSDCLLLADDFFQYYLGAFDRSDAADPAGYLGTGDPLTGLEGTLGSALASANPVDEAGSFTPTSEALPIADFPQFASSGVAEYAAGGPDPYAPVEGAQYAGATHVDDAYMRLTRTVDLTAVTAGQSPQLQAQLSFDTEFGYDNVIVEARTAGGSDWTTLPDLNGGTTTNVPTECEAGFLLAEHPFLANYLTGGDPCTPTGLTGEWNAFTGNSGGWQQVAFDLSAYAGSQVEVSVSYVTDPGTGGVGVFVDDTRVVVGGVTTESEGFEAGLGAWSVPGAPADSPGNRNDFTVSTGLVPPAQAAIATEDTVLLGFGLEQVADEADRDDLIGRVMSYLLD